MATVFVSHRPKGKLKFSSILSKQSVVFVQPLDGVFPKPMRIRRQQLVINYIRISNRKIDKRA